jgi:tetratricopeptide (TPR) repeat protein
MGNGANAAAGCSSHAPAKPPCRSVVRGTSFPSPMDSPNAALTPHWPAAKRDRVNFSRKCPLRWPGFGYLHRCPHQPKLSLTPLLEATRHSLGEALRLQPDDFGVLYNVACNYAKMGDLERALDTLDRAMSTGAGSRSWIEHARDFANIPELPRFKQIAARLQ